MKTLTNLIEESAKDKAFAIKWAESIKDAKLTKDQIVQMLTNLGDIKMLKSLSDYLYETYTKTYIAYQPADDMFISDSKKDRVISNIAEFIFKHIV